MDSTSYRTQAGAFRANHRKAMEIGFHSAGVTLPHVAKPAGFDFPSADPLTTLASRRQSLLAALRKDRAELARRDAERAEYRALGIEPARYILSDDLIRGRMAARRADYLRFHRGEFLPLTVLISREADLVVVDAFRQWLRAA